MTDSSNKPGRQAHPNQGARPCCRVQTGCFCRAALRAADIEVYLQDISPTSLALARDLGAGEAYDSSSPEPALVIVAVPPDVTAEVCRIRAERPPGCSCHDAASVKSIIDEVEKTPVLIRPYAPSHPMAGVNAVAQPRLTATFSSADPGLS